MPVKSDIHYKLPFFLILSLLAAALLPNAAQAQGWYNSGWLYRKAITVDYTKVGAGPHINFPLLVSRTDTDLRDEAQADGDDILFTSSDGTTKISHEIESYTSASGALVAWVEIPSLSSSANTVIYMYYGNAAIASQQDRTGTWDASFKGVYHLNAAFADATSNANNGTNTGTTDVAGKISKGRGFVPADGADNISINGLFGSPASISLSAWFYRNSTATETSNIIGLGDQVFIQVINNATGLQGGFYNGTTWLGTVTNTNYDNAWHYAVYTYTSGGNSQKVYIDGTLVTSTTNAGAISYTSLGANSKIGGHSNGSTAFDMDGNLDEVRVASAARSAGWVLTEYNNQNSPATFYSTGAENSNSKTFTGTGNFSTAARWTGGTVPVAGDNITIDGACTVDNNAGTDNIAYGTLTIGTATGRTLNWIAGGTNRLNVSNVTNGAGLSTLDMTNGGTLAIRGTLLPTNLVFTPGTGTIEIRSSITLPNVGTFNNLTINGAGITVALSAATAINGTLKINAGTFNVNNFNITTGRDWINNGTFTPGTATVTFDGTTVISGTTTTNIFNNLTIDPSSTVTSSAGITGLVVNGILNTGAGTILDLGTTTVLSGTLSTISNSGTIKTSVTSATPLPAGKTWGGTVDYTNANGGQTVVQATYNNLTVRPGNGKTTTAGGNLVVNGTLTITTAFGALDLSTYVLSGSLTSISNSGDLKTSVPTSTSSFPLPAGKDWGGTVYYNAASGAQTIVGGIYNILRFTNTSGTNTASGDLTVNNQFVTAGGGTLNMGTSYRLINMGSTITNDGTVKTSVPTTTSAAPFPTGKTWGGSGTVEYAAAAGAQTVMSGTYNNLKLSNTSGTNTVSGDITVGGVLTFTAGTITTGSFLVYLNATGTVSRTSGHIIGNFKKYIATGATSKTFEIGDVTNYTPVTIAFASVTTAGDLSASTTGTVHANIGSSSINSARAVNRTWTLTNSGIVFTNYSPTFNFVASDVDAGATTANFIVGRYSAGWSYPTVGTKTSTSTQATGLTAFGDFQVGETACSTPAAPTVVTPVNYCQNATAAQLTATGTNLIWNTGTTAGSVGGTSILTTNTYVDGINAANNRKTLFTTTTANVTISTVDYYINAYQAVTNLKLALFNASGTEIATSSTTTTRGSVNLVSTITNTFNYTITSPGNYSIGVSSSSGTGVIGGDAPVFPITETTGTINVTGVSPATRCFNNIQFAVNGSSTAPTPITTSIGTTNYTVTQTVNGCISTNATIAVVVSGTPSVANAGSDQTGPATCGLTSVTLAANTPSVGTGAWSIVSGTGGTIATASSPTSTFTGTAGTTYTLRWTISNSPCTASTDDVVITFNQNPTISGTSAVSCVGGSTGTITALASGGSAPYTYSLNAGAYQSSTLFTGLGAGSYTLNVKSNAGCVASTSVAVSDYATSSDNQNTTATNSWIGHMYDGTSFTNYIGQFTEAETFNETFGGDYVCFNVSSASVTRSIYTETFSVKYRMNSTRRGLYVADLGSDDGSRLSVDGTLVYNNWNDQGFTSKPGVLMNLTGSSSLLYEFYESSGGNQVAFQNLTLVLANALSANTSQSLCIGNTGAAISGDIYGTLTTGIALSATGYQWSYSTTPGGARTNISGATGATFTPSATGAPFNIAGTYYIYRNAVLSSGNNISPNPYLASNESNAAIITVSPLPTTAVAGPDQNGAATCGLTTVTLAANTPTIGTGSWSIVSGTGGVITTASSPTSAFTGTAGNTYVLRWTISNGSCTTSTSDVTLTFNRLPTTSNAGANQTGAATCGLTTVTLAANTPTIGTGSWSIVSGTGGIITTASSPTSTFTGTAGNTYILRWTISNSPCTASTSDVTITFNRPPTTSNAGPDQTGATTCGLTTITLAGNTPSIGTGAWTVVSGTGGSFGLASNPTSTFSGTAGNTYTLRWTISNSPCPASIDDVVITFHRNPTTSAAGADQTGAATCGLTIVTLAGNIPSIGTGMWSIVSGTGGSFSLASNPISTFSGTAGNTYTLRWTISNSPCTASIDDVVITFNQSPTLSNAGPDQTGAATCGLTTVTLAGNIPSVGTGAWSIVSGIGGSFGLPSNPTSTFSGTAGNTYTLRWTISNSPCTASIDDVVVTFNQSPTLSSAGPDQAGAATCGLITVTLAGNTASIGTGVWSIVSGTGGSFGLATNPTSTFSGTAGNTYTLRWTISNSPCTASIDDVVVTFNQSPTISNAGPDQIGTATCGLTTVTLAGNIPSVGTGAWSIVSGIGGSFGLPSNPTSTFSGTAGNTYTLRWTISNSPCTASIDDVVVTFNQSPTLSSAGPDQAGAATCGLTTVTLAGNTASVGTGAWTILSGAGGTITTPSSATSTFSGTAGTSYTLRWTITNSPCTASTDDVVITFNRIGNNLLDYTNGTHGILCTTAYENNPATLTAPAGTIFINVAFASYGTPAGSCSTFTIGSCHASTSQAVAESYFLGNNTGTIPATNAVFGDPCLGTGKQFYVQAIYTQPICSGTAPGIITGTNPTAGTGVFTYLWEQSTTNASSGFSASPGTNNTIDYTPGILTQTTWFRRTVTSGACYDVSKVLQVTVTPMPVAAISYSSPVCIIAGTATVTQTGTTGGSYSSTPGLVINSTTGEINPGTSNPGTYTVTYTMAAAGGCTVQTATSSVTINQIPTTSNAGADQTGATTCGLTSVTLAANTPSVGTGAWSIISGAGGTISTQSNPTSTFSGTAGTTYTLRWTISNSPCTASIDDVVIIFNQTPTVSNAGADQTGAATCGLTTVTLAGNTPSIGTGAWSIVSGTGGSFGLASNPTSTFSGTAGTTYTLRWTISNSPCTSSADDVVITFHRNPTTSAAGADQTGAATCGLTTITLAGNTPSIGTGAWTVVSGTGGSFSLASNPTSTFSGTAGTTYTLRWTISNSPCTASIDDVVITFNQNSASATVSYGGTPFCKSVATAQAVTQTGTTGGTYTASPAGLTINTSTGSVTPGTSTAGGYTVTYTMVNGPCITTATTSVTITTAPSAAISYAGNPYCSSAGTATVSQTGTSGGTYTASPGGLSINSTSGAVNLGASTAGTYTITYTVAASSGCAVYTTTTTLTVTVQPYVTGNYAGNPYCTNFGVAYPSGSKVGADGVLSSTAGLSINSSTGVIDLGASLPGSYTITYSVAPSGGCALYEATYNLVIIASPSATITYPATSFCANAGLIAVTRTGTSGGVYSSAAGLSINASTGEINTGASTPGSYIVTYRIAAAGSCSAFTTTKPVTITALPSATISYAGVPYCSNAGTATVIRTGTAGGTYSSTGGLTIDGTTGSITLGTSTPGSYTVTYTVAAAGGCSLYTTTAGVAVSAPSSATISYAGSPYCTSAGTATITRTGTAGGTFSSTEGLSINGASGDIILATSTAGTYTVTYTMVNDGCTTTATTSLTITAAPSATISYAGTPYCSNSGTANVTRTGTAGGTYSSTAGLIINGTTGDITLASSTAGIYTVTYTVAASGGCAVYTATASVIISSNPSATISYAGTPYCSNAGTATVSFAGTTGGSYSSTAGLVIDGVSGDIDLGASTAGAYTVTYTIAASGGCALFQATASVTITTLAAATISFALTPFCKSLATAQAVTQTGTSGGAYTSSPAGLTIDGTTGAITPSTSTAGIYTVTYALAATGGCAVQTATTSVNITTLPAATISYGGTPFCKSLATGQPVTQTGTSGGVYTASPAGLTIVAGTGAITPSTSTAGTYTVTYTMAATGGCAAQTATTSVTITTLPAATITYATPFCKSVVTAQSVTRSGTAGGAYTASPAGLTINASTGAITPGSSTAGTYMVTYTMAATGGCSAQTATRSVTITTLPAATISYGGSPFCKSVATAQSVTRNGTAGGTYTRSPAGLTIVAGTGAITPSTSTAGTYTVTYTMAAAGGCAAQTATTTVTITTLPSATISYAGTPFCKSLATGQAVTQTGTTGGSYTAPAGLSIVAGTGEITPSTSTAGTYTVTYTNAAGGGCAAQTATATVTITDVPGATIAYTGTPYCSTGGTATVSQTGTAGGIYSSAPGLTLNSSTGDITLGSSSSGTYTVTYTVAAAGGCTVYTTTTSVSIKLNGTWTGAVNNNWNVAGNWLCSFIPVATTNVIIPGSLTNYPVLGTGTSPVNNLTIEPGATLTVNDATLQIAGTIANSGTFTAANGTIEMNGSSAQVIPPSTFAGNVIKSLKVNNTANVTLGGTINLIDVLTVSSGALTTGGYLTLKSSATATASIANITSNAVNPIVGNVTVERYIPGKRKYRLITSSVTTSSSPFLTTGQESLSIWGHWQNGGINNVPNSGIIITGGSVADGFDQQTGNTSLLTYNDSTRKTVGYTSANGKNTKRTPLKAGIAYFMFVYGDRVNAINVVNPNATVIRATGVVLTGDQSYSPSSNIPLTNVPGRWTLLGNPFASPVNWATMPKTNLANTYWGYDPNLSSTGGYVTVSTIGTQTITSPRSGSIGINQYIQPGQGFFVKTIDTSPSLTIREQDKTSTFNPNAFRGNEAGLPLLAVNLWYETAGTKVLTDGALAAFDPAFSNGINNEDAVKINNSAEVIGIANGADLLSIDTRQMPSEKDTLFLNVLKLTKAQYTLQIFAEQMEYGNVIAYLEDSYLKTRQYLSLTDTNRIVVNVISSIAASYDVNRFRIVFDKIITLPVTFTSVTANKKDNNIQVKWAVATEEGINKYEIERSADGQHFTKAGEVTAHGSNSTSSYSWLDVNAGTGNNYYRIRAMQSDGTALLSKVVMVKMDAAEAIIKVLPNPIKGSQINLQLVGLEQGVYSLSLFNSRGQIIFKQNIDHTGGTGIQQIYPDKKLPAGVYYLKLHNSSKQYSVIVYAE